MKIKARNKLIPAIAMLVVAAVSLTSASYAWFTMSREVTATGMSLTAIAPTNLLISNSATGTYAETTAIVENYTGKLKAASSWNGLEFWAVQSVSAADAGAPTASTVFTKVTSGALSGSNDGYYADFHLWLATSGEDDVSITISQLLSSVTDGSYTKLDNSGSDVPAGATHYSVSGSSTIIPIEEGSHTWLATNTYYKLQSISGAVRFAVLDGAGTALTTANINNVYATKNNVSTENYFTNIVGPLKSTDYASSVQPSYLGSAIMANSSNVLFTVPGMTQEQIANGDAHGTSYPVTIRVWLEGQDADCISSNSSATFSLTVGFKDAAYTE